MGILSLEPGSSGHPQAEKGCPLDPKLEKGMPTGPPYSLGMDARMTACIWNTNFIMV